MQWLDVFVIVLYFVGVAVVGYLSSKKSLTDSKAYFLGGGQVGWLAIGQFEWLACLILILLGWLFAPFYLRIGVFTSLLTRPTTAAQLQIFSVNQESAVVAGAGQIAQMAQFLFLIVLVFWLLFSPILGFRG